MSGWRPALWVILPPLISCGDRAEACMNQADLQQRKACLAEVIVDQEADRLEDLDPLQRDQAWLELAKLQRNCLICREISSPQGQGACAAEVGVRAHMLDSYPAGCPAPRAATCPCDAAGMDLAGYGEYLGGIEVRYSQLSAEQARALKGDIAWRCVRPVIEVCPCLHAQMTAVARYDGGQLREVRVAQDIGAGFPKAQSIQACAVRHLEGWQPPADLSGEITWEISF